MVLAAFPINNLIKIAFVYTSDVSRTIGSPKRYPRPSCCSARGCFTTKSLDYDNDSDSLVSRADFVSEACVLSPKRIYGLHTFLNTRESKMLSVTSNMQSRRNHCHF